MLIFRKRLSVLFVVVYFFGAVRVAQADLVLQFSPDNSVNSVIVNEGQSFEIDIYIAQSGTFSGLSDSGLLGFGFRGAFSESMLQATGGTTDASFNISGTPNADVSTPGQVDMFGGSSSPPISAVIHLGTLNFKALSAGATSIAFGDLDTTFDDFTLNDSPNFTSLDSTLFGPGFNQTYLLNVTITSVPEPSSTVLSLSACAVFLICGWFRLRLAYRENSRLLTHCNA